MKKTFFPLLQICLCIFGYICGTGNNASAQVTSDGTVNTQVEQNGSTAEITGGETRGSNLFHSFQDFSVPTGNEAYFNNASEIANIFSRVTGGNISNIDGLIRANDSASLFLINPAGIIFGDNASLDLGGSFYGSTADNILFEGGEFSATDLDNPPLLTVNAPIGLGFRDEPGDIVNRSVAQNNSGFSTGLEVSSGRSIVLIGGDITFESGRATANGGNIHLGGLGQPGTISFDRDGNLSFPENPILADVTLNNGADVNVKGDGGNVVVDAQNLTLTAGESGSSLIRAGIASNSTSAEVQAGDITLNVADNISLNNSRIVNQVTSGRGNSGSININTGSLELINGSDIDTSTFSTGNAGAVSVTASDILVEGEAEDGSVSGITSLVNPDAQGDSGGVTISAGDLRLTGGGRISASTFGTGNAGAVSITATGDILVEGEAEDGLVSDIISAVNSDAQGDSGGVTISAGDLRLTGGGRVSASTFGTGNAGAVSVTATGDILVEGEDSQGDRSSITSRVNPDAQGNSGGVTISAGNLRLTGGGRVSAGTSGTGNAGEVNVTATGDILVEGEDSQGARSRITSVVDPESEGNSEGIIISTGNLILTNRGLVNATTGGAGNAGGIAISTDNLSVTDGGLIDASTFDEGNAGDLTIDAKNSIFISGVVENLRVGISANALINSGDSGNIKITTNQLTVSNNGIIEASNFGLFDLDPDLNTDGIVGTGRPGSITINAGSIELDNGAVRAATQFEGGQSGIINLQVAKDITLNNNSFISALAFENADGGNLNIDARFIIAFPSNGIGNDLVATAERGTGGNIGLDAEQLFGLSADRAINRQTNRFISNNENDIDVSGSVDGNLNINLTNVDPLQGTTELPETLVQTEQTSVQACQRRDRTAKSGLNVSGKGGVPPSAELPLSSLNITTDNQSDSISNIPAPIQTSQGKIHPARGIEVNKSGTVVLTAYHTNNAGKRLSAGKRNCSGV